VVTTDGDDLDLDDLRAHLAAAGVSKQDWPEYLVCRPELPLGPGGKVDKKALRRKKQVICSREQ
jgi:acyl-CoA synthetase